MASQVPVFAPAIPEITLAVGAMFLLMLGVFKKENAYRQVSSLSLILLAAVGIYLWLNGSGERETAFQGMFVTDAFSIFVKTLILTGSGAALALSGRFMKEHRIDKFEYPILILLATTGMMIMVSSNNLMSLYVGLELQSLSLYVLAAINRDWGKSSEAGLKYFVLGALSSGMLLYGISLIYGFAGSIDFDLLAEAFRGSDAVSPGIIVGLMFVLAGLSFKISAVPFHMWAPDVYEGAPTPVTAFFAAAPKIAAMALMVRVLQGGFSGLFHEWQQVIIFTSIASMLVGAFVALVQTNIKRLLAYSSIGHVGYALVGLAAGTEAGIEALLIYLAIYLTMTLGTFGVVLTMKKGGVMTEEIKDLAGLASTNLPKAVAMAIFMFSLAGIPLLAGFFGKWYVFQAAVQAGLWPLAVIGVVTSVVGAYYYLRIVKIMFFDTAEGAFDGNTSTGVRIIVYTAALVNSPFSYFILIAPLVAVAGWAARSLVY